MAYLVIKWFLLLYLLHPVQICVHSSEDSSNSRVMSRPSTATTFSIETSGQNPSDSDHEGRRLESVEIRAWMKNEMKLAIDHVEVRCQALEKGVLVKDFDHVTLRPEEERLWSAEQIDLTPDRVICLLLWKTSSFLIHDIYFANHNDSPLSNWDIDESGLNRFEDGSGSVLVERWREQKP